MNLAGKTVTKVSSRNKHPEGENEKKNEVGRKEWLEKQPKRKTHLQLASDRRHAHRRMKEPTEGRWRTKELYKNSGDEAIPRDLQAWKKNKMDEGEEGGE